MDININRNSIDIIPEDDQDRAFMEDTLKLDMDGEVISAARVDTLGGFFVKISAAPLTSNERLYLKALEHACLMSNSCPKGEGEVRSATCDLEKDCCRCAMDFYIDRAKA